jgi:hypothetical protein
MNPEAEYEPILIALDRCLATIDSLNTLLDRESNTYELEELNAYKLFKKMLDTLNLLLKTTKKN